MEIFVIFVLLCIIAIVFTVLACGEQSKCSKCGKWWALNLVEKTPVNCQPGIKLVSRVDVVRDQMGNIVGQVWRQFPVPVVKVTYDALFRCQYCGENERKALLEESEV